MTSPETVECRIYMAEDVMYRRSDELNRHLHELEARLKDLVDAVHRELCESGRIAVDVKTDAIVCAVEAFEAGIDLSGIRAEAERVTSLKGLIGRYEREMLEATAIPGPRPEDVHTSELVATAR
jgi:hypothetical protein